ncbi:Mechanosensitive ion channel-domain-containing protein [Blastocladiella britannica]|nr:Mechanosensitive ion channel-domain-containing protein [Blastocladiella britannica]
MSYQMGELPDRTFTAAEPAPAALAVAATPASVAYQEQLYSMQQQQPQPPIQMQPLTLAAAASPSGYPARPAPSADADASRRVHQGIPGSASSDSMTLNDFSLRVPGQAGHGQSPLAAGTFGSSAEADAAAAAAAAAGGGKGLNRRATARSRQSRRSRRSNRERYGDANDSGDEFIPSHPDLAAMPSSMAVPGGAAGAHDDYDWGIDNSDSRSMDEVEKSGIRRCVFLRSWLSKLPYWLQCLLSALLGDAIIFGILGVPDLFSIDNKDEKGAPLPFPQWTSKLQIGQMPLLFWAIYLCASWTLHYVTLFVLSIVPTLIQRAFGIALGSAFEEKLGEYLNYFRVMHNRITVSVWIILSNVIWNAYVVAPQWKWKTNGGFDLEDNWWKVVAKVLLSLFIFNTLWVAEKFVLEVIATEFHRRAYKDRVRISKLANGYLEQLLVALRAPRQRAGPIEDLSSPTAPLAAAPGINFASASDPSPRTSISQGMHAVDRGIKSANNVFQRAGITRAGQFIARQAEKTLQEIAKQANLDPYALSSASSIPSSAGVANVMARDLFHALVKPNGQELEEDDFLPYFNSPLDARKAFRMFDVNKSGDISKDELKQVLNEWMQEKKDIERSIADVSRAVGSLNYFLGAGVLLLTLVLICIVWNLPVSSYMSALAAVLLPGTFIFGATLKDTFENIVFLFVQHFFDVGDVVNIDGKFYTVVSMSIGTTTLRRGDGKIIYYPNSTLNKKPVENVRRSGNMNEDVTFKVDLKTTQDQLDDLTNMMLDFLDDNNKDFKPTFVVVIREVLLSEKAMLCKISIDYTTNWQEMGKRAARRNKFMFQLRESLLAAGIACPAGAGELAEHQ